mgnify:CR=1 FL=1
MKYVPLTLKRKRPIPVAGMVYWMFASMPRMRTNPRPSINDRSISSNRSSGRPLTVSGRGLHALWALIGSGPLDSSLHQTLLNDRELLIVTDNVFGTEGAETRFYRVRFAEAR